MYIKKRKRKRTVEQEFTVVAKDSISVEIIEQKATQKKIEVFRKGHGKNRLYFRCVSEKKDRFLKDIGDICFWESPVTLPNSILRRYRRCLLKTAVNRLNRKDAQAALKVLMEHSTDKNGPASATQIESVPSKTALYNKPATSIKPRPKPAMWKSAIYGLKNFISRVRSFIKPRIFNATSQN